MSHKISRVKIALLKKSVKENHDRFFKAFRELDNPRKFVGFQVEKRMLVFKIFEQIVIGHINAKNYDLAVSDLKNLTRSLVFLFRVCPKQAEAYQIRYKEVFQDFFCNHGANITPKVYDDFFIFLIRIWPDDWFRASLLMIKCFSKKLQRDKKVKEKL